MEYIIFEKKKDQLILLCFYFFFLNKNHLINQKKSQEPSPFSTTSTYINWGREEMGIIPSSSWLKYAHLAKTPKSKANKYIRVSCRQLLERWTCWLHQILIIFLLLMVIDSGSNLHWLAAEFLFFVETELN